MRIVNTFRCLELVKNGFLFLGLLLIFSSYSKPIPAILIIGDSISIGYTPTVVDYFSDKAVVKHNKGNAQHTGTGLIKIEEWIGKENWDIVQFNWGLWDLCYRHEDSKVQGNRDKMKGNITYELEEYGANLDTIIEKLKRLTNAKLIFVTTSYVPKNEAGRFKNDAKKYNKLARKIMKKHGIIVNDIYDESKQIHRKFGKGDDDVHFNKKGYIELGRLIGRFLEKELSSLKNH